MASSDLATELLEWIHSKIANNGLSAIEFRNFEPTTVQLTEEGDMYETLSTVSRCERNPQRRLKICSVHTSIASAVIDLCEAGLISFKIDTTPHLTLMTLAAIPTGPVMTDIAKFSRQTKDHWMLLWVCKGNNPDGGRFHWGDEGKTTTMFKWNLASNASRYRLVLLHLFLPFVA